MRSKAIACLTAFAVAGAVAMPAAAATPSNTVQPTISGTPIEGKTLRATAGTWANTPTSFVYHWQRCSAAGASCVTVLTSSSNTYRLKTPDVDHTIRVAVTASNATGRSSATSKQTPVVASIAPPKATALPAVSGLAQVGEQLSATAGTWSGGAQTFSFQWQGCNTDGTGCVDITGATAKTYTARSEDAGRVLRVKVTAKSLSGSTTASSTPTDAVELPPGASPTTSTPIQVTHVNQRPTIHWLSVKVLRGRVYARYRLCDDSGKRVTVIERDLKRGVGVLTRRWSNSPSLCGTYRHVWVLKASFHGRVVLTLRARDYAGKMSGPTSRVVHR